MGAIMQGTWSFKEFDEEVKAHRLIGVPPRHKPTNAKKADCTPEQWAAHLEWRAIYYAAHKKDWKRYANRWLSKKRAISN